MSAPTRARGPEASKVAEAPRHHVCSAAIALEHWDRNRSRRSRVAFQRRLERARELLGELGEVVEANPELSRWLTFWLAPALRVATPCAPTGSLAQRLAIKASADALEDPLQLQYAQDPSEANRVKLAKAVREEMESSLELLALLDKPGVPLV